MRTSMIAATPWATHVVGMGRLGEAHASDQLMGHGPSQEEQHAQGREPAGMTHPPVTGPAGTGMGCAVDTTPSALAKVGS